MECKSTCRILCTRIDPTASARSKRTLEVSGIAWKQESGEGFLKMATSAFETDWIGFHGRIPYHGRAVRNLAPGLRKPNRSKMRSPLTDSAVVANSLIGTVDPESSWKSR